MSNSIEEQITEPAAKREMTVYSLDPLEDPRWAEFVQRHPRASVFHTPGWLEALRRTYGYEPVVYTTSLPRAELTNGLVFCRVRSWLTGRRLVSLPFSDHCEPLVHNSEEGGFHGAKTFYLHRLDLRPSLDALLRSFDKDSVQRKIRRAEREGLTYEGGRSESLLQQLYGLLRITRRRHHLPPQPLDWFRNLVDCLGEDACIRIASKGGQPVAGILTLSHGKRMVYKYGGSDARLNSLGGMALLYWKTIQDAKQAGTEEFDLGRSDCDNAGLIVFKERWAADRSTLTNWRCPASAKPSLTDGWRIQLAKQISSRLPDGMLIVAGKLLYRHIG